VLSRQRLETRALNREFKHFSLWPNAVNLAEFEQKCRPEIRNGNVRFGAGAGIQTHNPPAASSNCMRPNFHEVPGLWERDGSLRDIYVHDTNAVHWDRFDRLLSQYECTYTFDGGGGSISGIAQRP
jgi:hypothetical protein